MNNAQSPDATLAALRDEVDEIDEQIVLLLGLRLRASDTIAALGHKHGFETVDQDRERQQIERIQRLAGEAGVPPALAATILRAVIETVKEGRADATGA